MKNIFSLLYVIYIGLLPIFGLFFFNWSIIEMLSVFWYESLLFYIFNFVKIFLVNDFSKSDKVIWYVLSNKKYTKKREYLESFSFFNLINLFVFGGWIFMVIVPMSNEFNFSFFDLGPSFLFLFIIAFLQFISEMISYGGFFSKKQLFPKIEKVAYLKMVVMYSSLFLGTIFVQGISKLYNIKNSPLFIIGFLLSFFYLLINVAENIANIYNKRICLKIVRIMDKFFLLIKLIIFILTFYCFITFNFIISISFLILSIIFITIIRLILVQILLKLNLNKDIKAPCSY